MVIPAHNNCVAPRRIHAMFVLISEQAMTYVTVLCTAPFWRSSSKVPARTKARVQLTLACHPASVKSWDVLRKSRNTFKAWPRDTLSPYPHTVWLRTGTDSINLSTSMHSIRVEGSAASITPTELSSNSRTPTSTFRPTMGDPPVTLTPLILAGGKSTRMGSPKHLLPMPDNRPLYQHQIELLHSTLPEAPVIYISLARDSHLDHYLQTLAGADDTTDPQPSSSALTSSDTDAAYYPRPNIPSHIQVRLLYDPPPRDPTCPGSSGPATGLLAAFAAHPEPERAWLVVACDQPLLTPAALAGLARAYRAPATCFRNGARVCEPLVGVWSGAALAELRRRVLAETEAETAAGRGVRARVGCGPARVARELGAKEVAPGDVGVEEDVLTGVNTPSEWETVRARLVNLSRAAGAD